MDAAGISIDAMSAAEAPRDPATAIDDVPRYFSSMIVEVQSLLRTK